MSETQQARVVVCPNSSLFGNYGPADLKMPLSLTNLLSVI